MSVFNETLYELNKSINSILIQNFNHFELIIVDDNPNSLLIKKYLLNKQLNNDKIKLIFNDKNKGAIFSRNVGMKKAKGKYIMIMDADDIANKNRILAQIQFLNKYDLDLVCSNFSIFDDKQLIQKYSYIDKDLTDQIKIKYLSRYFNIVIGPTILFKRELLNILKGYRNILAEDYDLAIRVMTYGYKIGYQSRPLIKKRERKNSLSNINSLKEFVVINTIRKYIKRDNFKTVISIQTIEKSLNKINIHDYQCYKCFVINSRIFKNKHSVINLLKKYYYTLTSKIVFKRNLWMKLINKRQDRFL